MAKLAPITFNSKSETDEVIEFKSEVTVSQSGEFALTIPDYLEDVALARLKTGRPLREITPSLHGQNVWADAGSRYAVNVERPKLHVRVIGKNMETCCLFIKQVCRDFLACDVKTERVILYATNITVYCFKGEDGNLYANGYDAGRSQKCDPQKAGQWAKIGQNINNNNSTEFYNIGIVARVMNKVTYVRSSGSKIEYTRCAVEDYKAEPYLCKLNSFCHISIPYESRMEQMPYTEDAAQFFYDTMIGMCRLAERIDSFFKDKEALVVHIENKARFLTLPSAVD